MAHIKIIQGFWLQIISCIKLVSLLCWKPQGNTYDYSSPNLIVLQLFVLYSGDGLNNFYIPVFVPIGLIGNILSFLVSSLHPHLFHLPNAMLNVCKIYYLRQLITYIQSLVIQAKFFFILMSLMNFRSSVQVMMQPQNRHMSFSLYISSLAVSDTIAMLIGESELHLKGYIKVFSVEIFSKTNKIVYYDLMRIFVSQINSNDVIMTSFGGILSKVNIRKCSFWQLFSFSNHNKPNIMSFVQEYTIYFLQGLCPFRK